MWSCKFGGQPVEFSILLMNPFPGKSFNLGSVKVWNWNNKISVSYNTLFVINENI